MAAAARRTSGTLELTRSLLRSFHSTRSSRALRNDIPNAIRSIRAAESLLPAQQAHLTPRESAYVSGYGAMLSNQLREALGHFQRALDHCPGDLFAVKKVQLLAFVLGGRPDMLAVALRPDIRAACEGKRFFLAMLGFALEENERVSGAQARVMKHGRRAAGIANRNY